MTPTPPGAPAPPDYLPPLAACPCCGGEARWEEEELYNYQFQPIGHSYRLVVAHSKECIAGATYLQDECDFPQPDTMPDADYYAAIAAAWNRRPAEDALRARVAALESDLASARGIVADAKSMLGTLAPYAPGSDLPHKIIALEDEMERLLNRETP